MNKTVFNVSTRADGQNLNQLRKQGVLPANVFGHKESLAVQADAKQFAKMHHLMGDSSLLYLQVDDKAKQLPVMIDEVQYHPVSGQPVHVAFKQVSLSEKIKAEIPVVTVGTFNVPDAVLMTVKSTVEVEALPTELPEKFEIDVSKLTEVGQAVTLNDLVYDKEKVTLVVGEEGLNEHVVSVQHVKEEKEEETPVAAEEAVPAADAATAQKAEEPKAE